MEAAADWTAAREASHTILFCEKTNFPRENKCVCPLPPPKRRAVQSKPPIPALPARVMNRPSRKSVIVLFQCSRSFNIFGIAGVPKKRGVRPALQYTMLIPYLAMPLPYHTILYPSLPYHTTPYPTLPYLPYPTLPYPTLQCPTLSYPTITSCRQSPPTPPY